MTLVFNASPLIVLAKAGLMEVMAQLDESAVVPLTVVDEILRVDDTLDPARQWFELARVWPEAIAAPPMSGFLAGWDLGAGESAVISLAFSKPSAVAVLDDLAARRCAQAHGIQLTGTLGLILLAKKRGLISKVGPALDSIVAAGLYVSKRTLADVRDSAGE